MPRGDAIQRSGCVVGREERLDLGAERGVAEAGVVEVGRPLLSSSAEAPAKTRLTSGQRSGFIAPSPPGSRAYQSKSYFKRPYQNIPLNPNGVY